MEKTKKEQEAEVKKIVDDYAEVVKKHAIAAQESGDIPTEFVYSYNGKTWVCLLPRSVMAQKHIMNLRNKTLLYPDDFDVELEFLNMIAKNVQVNGSPVNLELLDYDEVDVMRTAYADCILLPLSLGVDKKIADYMKAATANIK